MAFREISPWEWQTAPMRLIGQERMLLLASAGGAVNGMTVAWGCFGVMWGEPCISFAVRPSRFSYHLTEAGDTVSLCALGAEKSAALAYFGTHSGREGDKFAAMGLSPITMPCGGVGVVEAELVITARKKYAHTIQEGDICDPALISRWYGREGFHKLYVAAVQGIYVKE